MDWLPPGEGWELSDTLRFAPILAAEGIDMLDVSSGGTDRRQKVEMGPQYQVKFAKAVKDLKIPGLCIGAVGWIRDGATVADVGLHTPNSTMNCLGRVADLAQRSSKMKKQTSVQSRENSCETRTLCNVWHWRSAQRSLGQTSIIAPQVQLLPP